MSNEPMPDYFATAEELARTNPPELLRKIKRVVRLSYLYFGTLLGVSVGITLLSILSIVYLHSVGLYLAIASGSIAYVIFKGLFFKVAPIHGYQVSAKDCPALFDAITDLEKRLSIHVHAVFVDESLNAGAAQVASFGVFGGYKNFVIIGLPLFLMLSAEEAKAVLSHELAHLSNNDGKSMGYVHHIRQSWVRMMQTMEGRHRSIGAYPINTYIRKVWPRLNAYTFAYTRIQEYRADDFAARTVGVNTWARSIARVHIAEPRNDLFWREQEKRMVGSPEPSRTVYTDMASYHNNPIPAADLSAWLSRALFEYTRGLDTHPSLEDRLSAQKVDTSIDSLKVFVNSGNEKSAAEVYFGSAYRAILAHFDLEWFNRVSRTWGDVQCALTQRREGAKLEEVFTSEEEFWKAVGNKVQRDGVAAVESYIDAHLKKDENHATALFLKARILLERNNPEGESLFLRLIDEGRTTYQDAYPHLYAYYVSIKDRDKARALELKVQEEARKSSQVAQELNEYSVFDTVIPHDLSHADIEVLRDIGTRIPEIAKIYVAKRILKSNIAADSYVVAVRLKRWRYYSARRAQELANKVVAELPFSGYVFLVSSSRNWHYLRVMLVRGSLVYRAR